MFLNNNDSPIKLMCNILEHTTIIYDKKNGELVTLHYYFNRYPIIESFFLSYPSITEVFLRKLMETTFETFFRTFFVVCVQIFLLAAV